VTRQVTDDNNKKQSHAYDGTACLFCYCGKELMRVSDVGTAILMTATRVMVAGTDRDLKPLPPWG